MGVFGVGGIVGGEQFLCAAAIAAGYELGMFEVSAVGPTSRRQRALIDVLVALGALVRDGELVVRGHVPSRPTVPRDGWGRIADVIRDDRPLAIEPGLCARMHEHLRVASAPAAREVVTMLGDGALADLGGGSGAYAAAHLEASADARATLVDVADVVAIARRELTRFGDRVRLVADDIRSATLPPHDAVLLANVLHLHGPSACAELCAAAARAVRSGGSVAIVELRVDPGRSGPLDSLLFALGMAIYTDDGDVYETARVRGWLGDAGLVDATEARLASAPEMIVVVARKP